VVIDLYKILQTGAKCHAEIVSRIAITFALWHNYGPSCLSFVTFVRPAHFELLGNIFAYGFGQLVLTFFKFFKYL